MISNGFATIRVIRGHSVVSNRTYETPGSQTIDPDVPPELKFRGNRCKVEK
jgi:hypothetical protein